MRRSSYQIFLRGSLILLFALAAAAQSTPPASSPIPADDATALIRSVRVLPGQNGAAIEIIATHPLTPTIATVEDPLRLVVDLPQSSVQTRMRISYRDPQIDGVRVDQFNQDPPSVRLVIDLSHAASASWDAAGNRLMIRLHPPVAQDPDIAAAWAANPDPTPVDGGTPIGGGLMLTGGRFEAGSAVSAEADTAVVHMPKGGQVKICPGTTVSVTASQNSHNVMIGMSTGALETHYQLEASGDSVLTPDFRIGFVGPGELNYAISADSRGNTCVRGLPGNQSSAVVSELMGTRQYQVRPSEEVVFRSGDLAKVDSMVPEDCGCRASAVPVMRAGAVNSTETASVAPAAKTAAPAGPAVPAGSETAQLPPSNPNDVHIQVDAPMVFRASDKQRGTETAENLPVSATQPRASLPVAALPPEANPGSSDVEAHPSNQGFFGKIGSFFGRLFH